MKEHLVFPNRMHQLKSQLQNVAEMELTAAREGLRRAETTVSDVYRRWQSSLGGPSTESVLELQYRTEYATMLQKQLEEGRQFAAAAAEQVRERLVKLKVAAIETEQWGHLSAQALEAVRQAETKRVQDEADDLAAGRFTYGQRREEV